MTDYLNQLQDLFREVFEDDELVISRETTAADVEDWDSLNHVALVVNVEAAFDIKFTSLEVAKLGNVGEFLELIEAKVGG
jgi:acyl carrier protein